MYKSATVFWVISGVDPNPDPTTLITLVKNRSPDSGFRCTAGNLAFYLPIPES
jgi:hypothetical protein